MEVEEAASPKDGDVSPINRSISNLIDEPKPSLSTPAPKKKAEPSHELRPNFSRVTPAQLDYISFPPSGRYQPVRPVSSQLIGSKGTTTAKASSKPGSAEKYAGGGGILLLRDLRPDEEAEFIELEPPPGPAGPEPLVPVPVAPNGNAVVSQSGPAGPHIALDENTPEAEAPSSFEVCVEFFDVYQDSLLTLTTIFSTLLIMTHRNPTPIDLSPTVGFCRVFPQLRIATIHIVCSFTEPNPW